MVKCLECGKELGLITALHLFYKHNMTMEEYKIKYPGAIIRETTNMEEMSKAIKKRKLGVTK